MNQRIAWVRAALALCFFAAGAVTSSAYTQAINGVAWTYTVANNQACVTGGPTTGDLDIPSSLGGYPVTSIAKQAFFACSNLTSVVMPDSVTRIGHSAFELCSGLTSVRISANVTNIDYWTFQCCENLTSVVIPDRVINIGLEAFYGCEGLQSLVIPNNVTNIDKKAFYACGGLTSVSIGNSVRNIGEYAFFCDERLTSISIPDSVTNIGDKAFYGGHDVTSLTIGNSVSNIGEGAFGYCTNLTSVVIPDSVTSIGSNAFYCCSGLTSVTLPNNVTNIGNAVFVDCDALTSLRIPDSVTRIGDYFCEDCDHLTSVTIGNGVTSIGRRAFWGCSKMTSLTIGNSVTNIDALAFCFCTALKTVRIPDRVTEIGTQAFVDCTGLTSLTIGKRVKTLGEKAFQGCKRLTALTIPDSVESIGDGAFQGCTGLKTLCVPASWMGTDKLAKADVPEGCTVTYHGPTFEIVLSDFAGKDIEVGEEVAVTASAVNAEGAVTYRWSGDAPGRADGNVFVMDTGAAGGPYTLACAATDAAGASASEEISFRIVNPPAKYPVTIAGDVRNGVVTADKGEAMEGEIVSLSATPASGYVFVAFWVNGAAIQGDSFAMPAGGAVVSAQFKERLGDTFRKISGLEELEEGEYVLVGSDGNGTFAAAAQLTGSTKVLSAAAVTPEGDAIASPAESLVWTFSKTEGGWTIHNAAIGYLGYTGSKNSAMAEATPSGKSTWTFSMAGGLFKVSNVGTAGRTLRYNYNQGSPRFACYASDTMKNLSLYKRSADVAPVEGFVIGGLEVGASGLSFDAPEGAFTVEATTNLLDADAWAPVVNPTVSGGRVILPIEGAAKVFRVVQ